MTPTTGDPMLPRRETSTAVQPNIQPTGGQRARERCPSCGSTAIRYEVEADQEGRLAARYCTCEACLHGWTYAASKIQPTGGQATERCPQCDGTRRVIAPLLGIPTQFECPTCCGLPSTHPTGGNHAPKVVEQAIAEGQRQATDHEKWILSRPWRHGRDDTGSVVCDPPQGFIDFMGGEDFYGGFPVFERCTLHVREEIIRRHNAGLTA